MEIREEKIWGRRRWLVLEKLIPYAKSFKVKLLGFGMPQFVVADMGNYFITVGFTSWSANDWVKGTAFNILSGYIGEGNYSDIYDVLKEKRAISKKELQEFFKDRDKKDINAAIGMIFRKGEGYFDITNNKIRFRKLISSPLPKELYTTSDLELKVAELTKHSLDNFKLYATEDGVYIFSDKYTIENPKYNKWRYYGTEDYDKKHILSDTMIEIDVDGNITSVKCSCKKYNRGSKNISDPCEHILALYLISIKFLKVKVTPKVDYGINDIMEKVL